MVMNISIISKKYLYYALHSPILETVSVFFFSIIID